MRFHSRNGSVTPTPTPNCSPRLSTSPTLKDCTPSAAVEHESWEEIGGRDAGASRCGEHCEFGGCHIGPPTEQRDRFADRELIRRRRQRVGNAQVG